MTAPRWTRSASFSWVLGAYLVAWAGAAITVVIVPPDLGPLWTAAIADLVATVVVFAFSRGLRCSSIYDPYWSVAPIFVVLYWVFQAPDDVNPIRAGAVLFFTVWWGLRLTWNWARGWPGLHHEDWRYIELRKRTGRFEFLIDLLGIHVFPTVQVFLGLTGAWVVLLQGSAPLAPLDAVAFVVTGGAVLIEMIADRQLLAFGKVKKPGEILKTGLWAYSRHPNYFGEISFWWGLWLFGVAAAPQYVWLTLLGPVAMTAMFGLVSIPWMDQRSSARRPAYAEHMRHVSAVIPWFPKQQP